MRARRAIGAAAGAALCAAMGPAVALAQPASPADPHPIIDGGYAGSTHGAVRLRMTEQRNGGTYKSVCSATLLDADSVLTAKHCVQTVEQITVKYGNTRESRQTSIAAEDWVTSNSADLAVITLSEGIRAETTTLATSPAVSRGDTVNAYGWGSTTGEDEYHTQSDRLKVAEETVTNVNGRDLKGGTAITARYANGIAAGGDSGGPMLNADGVQVGVCSTSNRDDVNNYVKVSEYSGWIERQAGL